MNYLEILETHDTKGIRKEYLKTIDGLTNKLNQVKEEMHEAHLDYRNMEEQVIREKNIELDKLQTELIKNIKREFRGCIVEMVIEPYKLEVSVNGIVVVKYENKTDGYICYVSKEYIDLDKGRKILEMYFTAYGKDNVKPEVKGLAGLNDMTSRGDCTP